MKRWDSLVDGYLAQCQARGLSAETLRARRGALDRGGCWLKRRRPRPNLEEVDGQLLIKCLKRRSHFRSKPTLASVSSQLRCFGEYLLEQGVWLQNPMRWIKGPRLDPRGKLPRRIGASHLGKLWEASALQRGGHAQRVAVT